MAQVDLKEKLEEWLNGGGTPLEYKTVRAFQAAGLVSRGGVYVEDAETKKLREIDAFGLVDFEIEDERLPTAARVEVIAVAECKASPDKAAVVLRNQPEMGGTYSIFGTVPAGLGAEVALLLEFEHGNPGVLTFMDGLCEFQGFAVKAGPTKKSTDKDPAFWAAMAVEDACVSMVRNSDTMNRFNEGMAVYPERSTIAIPVVVWGGPLFLAEFEDGTGEISVEEVETASVSFIGRNATSRGITSILFVSETGLPEFANRLADQMRGLETGIRAAYKRIIEFCETGDFAHLDIDDISPERPQQALQRLAREVSGALNPRI